MLNLAELSSMRRMMQGELATGSGRRSVVEGGIAHGVRAAWPGCCCAIGAASGAGVSGLLRLVAFFSSGGRGAVGVADWSDWRWVVLKLASVGCSSAVASSGSFSRPKLCHCWSVVTRVTPASIGDFVNAKGQKSNGIPGFNPYRKTAPDDYAKGAAYLNGERKMSFDLDMQVVEYAREARP